MKTFAFNVYTALLLSAIIIFSYSACTHRIEVVGDKDKPIPINAEIKIHIYQHAANNVDAMMDALDEDSAVEPEAFNISRRVLHAILNSFGAKNAYAAEQESPLSSAIAAYKEAKPYLMKGLLGENRDGYLSVINKAPSATDEEKKAAASIAAKVNKARQKLYSSDANSKGVSIRQIQAAYAKAFRNKAKEGIWVEMYKDGSWQWVQK